MPGPAKYSGNYDKQVAIFAQVAGAVRNDGGPHRDDTIIFYRQKHHWSWFIPIDDEVVSVGIVVPGASFKARRQNQADFVTTMLHEINPERAAIWQADEAVQRPSGIFGTRLPARTRRPKNRCPFGIPRRRRTSDSFFSARDLQVRFPRTIAALVDKLRSG